MSGNVSDQNCSYDDTIPGASSLDALHTPDFLVSFYINKKNKKKPIRLDKSTPLLCMAL